MSQDVLPLFYAQNPISNLAQLNGEMLMFRLGCPIFASYFIGFEAKPSETETVSLPFRFFLRK